MIKNLPTNSCPYKKLIPLIIYITISPPSVFPQLTTPERLGRLGSSSSDTNNMDEMRSGRFPRRSWDEDIADLANRMGHMPPNWPHAMMGGARRGGPWRERKCSGEGSIEGNRELPVGVQLSVCLKHVISSRFHSLVSRCVSAKRAL